MEHLISPFNVNSSSTATEWLRWKRSVNLYIVSQNITNDDQKHATILSLGGMALQNIFFALPHEQIPNGKTKYEHTIDLLDAVFISKKNPTYERYIFRQIKQNPGEPMNRYVNRLRQQAGKCEFIDVEMAICDQVVEGCVDPELRKKYLEIPVLTVEMIEEKARNHETQLMINVQPEISSSSTVHQCSSSRDNTCNHCGSNAHSSQDVKCPAQGKECYYCHRMGHFISECRKLKSNLTERTMTKASITNIDLVDTSSAKNDPIDDYDQDYTVMVSSRVPKVRKDISSSISDDIVSRSRRAIGMPKKLGDYVLI